MKYIKLFKTLADYSSFTAEDTFVMPNASYIMEEFACRYNPLPIPPKVTLKYNCTEDNLYAFSNGVQNVKKLTVDGNNVDFEPLQQNNYTIDILSSSISQADNGGFIVPEDYFILHPPTSVAIKLADATSVLDIDNVLLIQLFTGPDVGGVMGVPMPVSEYIASGMLILNDNNSISFTQDLLTAINTVVNMPGYKVTFCFADTNNSPIDTVIEYEGTTGGIPLPYYFETPGQHTVELELFDGQFGAIGMFSEFPNSDDASLTSITFNESISFIHNGTFICENLEHITCKSKKAPILLQNTNGKTDIDVPCFGTLVYPKRSDYSSWLDVNNGFGMYGWNQEPSVITCTYNVTDTTKPTQICYTLSDYNGDYFSEIKVDDVLMTNQSTEVTFTTTQEHIVTFKLKQMGIPSGVFRDCYSLTKVSISSNPIKIGDYAFSGCTGLTGITIPDSVTSIGNYAFNSCSGLTSIVIPDSVTEIGNSAFRSCSGLASITIGSGVTVIGHYAFRNCSGLTSIAIPDSVTVIGDYAFYDCKGLTGELVIPDSVTYIGNTAFYGCSGLTSIAIPDSVTSIGEGTFSSCSGLKSITIGSGVTDIGSGAFYDCKGLTSIAIPDSVTTIGREAFWRCSGLKSITIGSGVTAIGSQAFRDCSGLTGELVIPDSVTSISSGAFYGCSGLTSIAIPDGVTFIEINAFNGCGGLTGITIPDSVTAISNSAFQYCSGLTSITIGSGVTDIGNSAFADCSELTSITCYASTAPRIQSATFSNIKQNGTLYVPAGSDYSSWMSTSSDYLGYYNWAIQEMTTPTE